MKTRLLDNEMFEKRTHFATVRLHLNQSKQNKRQTCKQCMCGLDLYTSFTILPRSGRKERGSGFSPQFQVKVELNKL